MSAENQTVVASSAPRFVRLLHLYTFPKLSKSWGGIWETIGACDLDKGSESVWTIRRGMIWDHDQTLGEVRERVPQWLIEEYGHHIERPLGKPNADVRTGATTQSDNMPDDSQPPSDPPVRSTECSADGEMAAMLVKWKDRILHKAANNIEGHFLDSPVEDFTAEEEGFERGLRTAVDEVCKLMADPSYFGRSPQNIQDEGQPEKGASHVE